MNATRCCLLALLTYATHCPAGHGLINSFAGIEWLPEAGTTPEDWWYPGERLYERFEVARARDPEAQLAVLLGQARERIAECERLVRDGAIATLDVAVAAYAENLAGIDALIDSLPDAARDGKRLTWATTLLEHRYIVSTDYFDLPRKARPALTRLFDVASAHYAQVRARLPRRAQDSLFFREEEVRWSWEQAQGADAQGL